MVDEKPLTTELDGHVAILSMQHAPHNLLGTTLMEAILAGLAEAERAGARAILLKSGLRHFSAGAELSRFEERINKSKSETVSSLGAAEFLDKLESFPLPMVASVHGVCVGGGFELALACDFIIAARSAKIGSVEATIGLNPLMGAIQRQVQRAGALRAKEMSMLARRYDAATLERWNLINRVVEDDHLEEAALIIAQELAHGPTLAHKITKQIARIAVNDGVMAADAAMAELQTPLWSSEDLKIGMKSLQENGPGHAKFLGR